jgi:hypothetical protein
MVAASEIQCYRICPSYGFFALCLWTRFCGRLELKGFNLPSRAAIQESMDAAPLGGRAKRVSRGASALCLGLCALGTEEGRTRCCESAVSEQCLRNPSLVFGF